MLAGRDYHIVPFDPEKHGHFVFDSFRMSLRDQFPWNHVPAHVLLERLKRTLATPGTVALVAMVDMAEEPEDLIAGWVIATPGIDVVEYAVTRYSMRHLGICSTILIAVGIDPSKPVGVRYWTRAAERINRRDGWSLYHRVTEDEEAEAS